MHTVNFLIRLVEHHQILAYSIVYLGLIFEGEIVVISIGILAHLGALNIWLSLFLILLGAFTKTVLGYKLGKFLYNKYNHHRFFCYIQKRVLAILPKFQIRPFWSIFVSKFIMWANTLVIVFSGYQRINYKKFLKAEVYSTLIWAPVMLSLGYVFSYTALHVSREIWKFLMVVLVLFILFVLFDKLISWIYELFEEFYDDIEKQ
jgi:membrane-associated protein